MPDTETRTGEFRLALDSGYSRGFVIEFANGYAVSVRFSSGNYCANHHLHHPDRDILSDGPDECANAEVAIVTPEGVVREPAGYITPEMLARILPPVAAGDVAEAMYLLHGGEDDRG